MSNFINCVLDKRNVSPGEIITGKVYVGSYHPVNSSVKIAIYGEEECKFVFYIWVRKSEQHLYDEYGNRRPAGHRSGGAKISFSTNGGFKASFGGARNRPSHGRRGHGRHNSRGHHNRNRPGHRGRHHHRREVDPKVRKKCIAMNSYIMFNKTMDLTNGFLGPGEFTFPFSFQVPEGSPATFNYHKSSEEYAKINYRITASYGPNSDTEELLVQQHIPDSYSASHVATNNAVDCCCCISKGEVAISANFEKDNYRPGE